MVRMLLALDTATATASVALYELEHDTLLAEYTWLARRRHTQELLVTVRAMCERMGCNPDALRALAVTTGPGSFTGVRIALSVVKGLALGLATPPRLVGLPTLSVTAAPWLSMAILLAGTPVIYACIQAGRARYNWCRFGPGDKLARPAAADHGAGTVEQFCATLQQETGADIWLVGEIDGPLASTAAQLPRVQVADNAAGWRRAGALAALAAEHLANGTNDELHTLQPLYLQSLT